MKNRFIILTIVVFSVFIIAFMPPGQESTDPVNYVITLVEPIDQPAPGLQSFAFAQQGDFWLILAGRTNGFHGTANTNPNRTFPKKFANNRIWVINRDSSNAWSVNVPDQYKHFLSSTNTQHYQDDDTLYICGGYGQDSDSNYVTFPYLAAIQVDSLVQAIVSADTHHVSRFFTVIEDTLFKVTGGELLKMDDYFYLCVGQDFEGVYDASKTGNYTDEVRKFKINFDGTTLTADFIKAYSDGLPNATTQFHRRDLNVMPVIRPDGSDGITIFGGVFTQGDNSGFVYPINIYNTADSTVAKVDSSFEQRMCQYSCANISIYDGTSNIMYSTFLGGISLYAYNEKGELKPDYNLPFIKSVYTIRRDSSGVYSDYPQAASPSLPGYIGAEAQFIPLDNLLRDGSDEIIDFQKIPQSGGLIGYLYGGILSEKAQSSQLFPTKASNKIYEVHLNK